MVHISKRRDIIDRKALVAALDDLVGWSGYSAKTQVLEIFKDALGKGRAEIRRRFEDERAPGSEVVRENAYLIDQLVRTIHDFALKYVYPAANPMPGEQLSVVATGGYGRGELAPHS
ncbi:MAG: bifunctional uridylyltransferase/uridylyl-removing protein, partial [Proteobacteria bacterium]|nr:bifunctional uridylyltransferase/uridylyl-removing protein [Pseudomonadota bacterium]